MTGCLLSVKQKWRFSDFRRLDWAQCKYANNHVGPESIEPVTKLVLMISPFFPRGLFRSLICMLGHVDQNQRENALSTGGNHNHRYHCSAQSTSFPHNNYKLVNDFFQDIQTKTLPYPWTLQPYGWLSSEQLQLCFVCFLMVINDMSRQNITFYSWIILLKNTTHTARNCDTTTTWLLISFLPLKNVTSRHICGREMPDCGDVVFRGAGVGDAKSKPRLSPDGFVCLSITRDCHTRTLLNLIRRMSHRFESTPSRTPTPYPSP